ncbi:MAG: nicotinamide mononucleotide deamidase-related protein [Candidatus Geothermarchaeota archaeon]
MNDTDVWIISIGNELLMGKVVNTNATWLSRKLTSFGFNVKRIIVIPDDENEIIEVIRDALKRAKVIICTGGLGPTFDDKTSEALAKALDREWILNDDAFKELSLKLKKKGMELTRERLKMAYLPRGARPLFNPVGIAPGLLIEVNNKLIIALPGVPAEMEAMFEESVTKILLKKFPLKYFKERSLVVAKVPESATVPIISKLMEKYKGAYIKSLVKGGESGYPILEFYITYVGEKAELVEGILTELVKELKEELVKLGGEELY